MVTLFSDNTPEMTLKANDCIVSYSNALPLTDLFRRQAEFIHTGSDGQKYDVSVPSLRASASFKYFGVSNTFRVNPPQNAFKYLAYRRLG